MLTFEAKIARYASIRARIAALEAEEKRLAKEIIEDDRCTPDNVKSVGAGVYLRLGSAAHHLRLRRWSDLPESARDKILPKRVDWSTVTIASITALEAAYQETKENLYPTLFSVKLSADAWEVAPAPAQREIVEQIIAIDGGGAIDLSSSDAELLLESNIDNIYHEELMKYLSSPARPILCYRAPKQ